ncbi:MAG TPA: response regulator [Opitutaceae bacterium]|nr:response regulator [Opitutaceae bacterium]
MLDSLRIGRSRLRCAFGTALAFSCLWLSGFAAEISPSAPSIITSLRDYWALPIRSLSRPIRMEALVYDYDQGWGNLWVEVNGEGGYLPAATKLPFRSGDRVLIEGTVIAKDGLRADSVKVTVLERDVPVTPIDAKGILAESARLKTHVVTLEAIFDRERISDNGHLELDCVAEGMRVHVFFWSESPQLLHLKQGARVRLTGVYNGNHDPQTSTLEIDIWVAHAADIVFLNDIEEDSRFGQPIVPIDELNVNYMEHADRSHILGRVRAYTPGKSVTLRDGTGQVFVQTLQTLPLQIGDAVEAVGQPFTGGADWQLRHATVRKASPVLIASRLAQLSNTSGTLRLNDEILELPAAEAAEQRPVDVKGLVVWAHPKASFFYLKDPSGTLRVQLASDAEQRQRPKVREQIHVTGVTDAGVFAPQIHALQIEQTGQALLPEARVITLDQAMTGLEEGQRVAISGHVQRVTPDGDWSRLTITTQTGAFTYVVERDDSLEELTGSIVSVEGLCHATANSRRQLTGIEVLGLLRSDIRIEQPVPQDLFAVPRREISSLRQYNANLATNYWARVRGVVTYYVPGRFVFIQDKSDGMLLLTERTTPLEPGDQIEAVGLPGLQDGRVVLREAVFREINRQDEPPAVELEHPSSVVEDLDSRLAAVSGTVMSTAIDGDNLNMTVEADRFVFSALLARDEVLPTEIWRAGTRVRLTGLYEVVRDERRQARGFHLRLRSLADVRVLQEASWWTPGRAFAVTGVLASCIGLGLTWLVVLRRRVTRQTDLIRSQLLKEAKLEAHHRAIVSNASDVIFTTDLNGHFTSLNPSGERLLGYTREEVMKMTLRDLVAPEDEACRNAIVSSLPTLNQSAARFELRFLTKDGRRIWMEVSACLVQQDGQALSLLGVARDIGERKLIEEELKRARDAAQANTEAKSAFLANMSHEIRTPMNGVIGMSNLLLDTPLNDDQHEYAQTIRNSAEALLTVLNDILDFSKIEAGKLHFDIQDFDLINVLEETLELLAPRAVGKGIELTLFVPPDLPRDVRGDPGRLRQVLVNLIGNALKFTSAGEVAVNVTLLGVENGNARLRFEVRDTGVGISEETVARLFRPFSQADASTTRRFGGTGLGLAISKQIVELMHGAIGVESKVGQGSTFWFTAQLMIQPPPTHNARNLETEELADLRVLAVDDHDANRRVLTAYTSAWGMKCDSVSSVEEATSALRAAAKAGEPYQLVLTDYHMPQADGLRLAKEIRNDDTLRETTIIMLTSVDRRFSVEEMAEHGLHSVLTKPIHTDELLATIKKAVAPRLVGRAASRAARQTEANHAAIRTAGSSTNGSANAKKANGDGARTPEAHAARTIEVVSAGIGDAAAAKIAAATAVHRPLRVLVAEDNAVNQRLVHLQLKRLGYHPDFATNGSEVLKSLERKEYDVILMDCQMPDMDGYEASRAIRRDERFRDVRIIAMTANAMQGDREKCLEAGMDDYLAKPTRLAELKEALLR